MPSPQSGSHPSLWFAARHGLLACIIVAVTATAYAPVRHHPFIGIDDYGYVVNNYHLKPLNWEMVKWSFTTFHYSNWDPLTWLSHGLDIRLWGLNAGRHHRTSLAWHTLNALLLFWLLAQATGYIGRSFAAAALFALHPVNVEAVAWVAERKTVLSMAFFLATLIAYRWYASRPNVGRYFVVALLFAMGLMSKPQVITLPFVLLLWDYWPLGRMFQSSDALSGDKPGRVVPGRSLGWLLLEKVPLLGLSAGSAYMTMKAQWVNGTLGGLNTYPFSVRLAGSIVGYAKYVEHFLWPRNLSFFYPHAHTAPPLWQVAATFLLLLLTTALTLVSRSRRYLAVGWLWFLGTLVPMIQLVQVGNHAMADRYAYVPFVGLFVALCWGVADVAQQWSSSKIWLPAATVAALVLLMVATRRQVNYWTDDLTLWTHAAKAVPNNAMAENVIGETLQRRGDGQAAIDHFRAAEAMDPLFPFPHLHLGIYEEEQRHPRKAIAQFQQVIDLTQSAAAEMPAVRITAFAHMSFAYNQLGDYANQQKYLSLAAQAQQQP